jgi:DNA-binding NtrC family response regulator
MELLLRRINDQEGYYGGRIVLMNSDSTRKSIVLVDDENDLVQLFSEALKAAGFDTIPFDKSTKALEYLRENHSKISLVLTDWRMPQISGLELTKKVSEIDDKLKVVLMSAYELEKDQLNKINKTEYLQKPLHLNQLIDEVKKEVYGTSRLQPS